MPERWPPEPILRLDAPEERMDPTARAGLVLAKLRAQVEYAWERSPFYQRRWEEAGVSPDSLETLADLARFPLLHKRELQADQEEHPPLGSNVCCRPEDVARLQGTSGTTGVPTLFAISRDDWARVGAAHGRIMHGFGLRPGDTVLLGSFFTLYLGGWGALVGAEVLGLTVIPLGAGVAGQTERTIELMRRVQPDAFYGTPSYALHMARVAADKGVDPAEFGLRIMFFSGEAGAGIPATKRRIEETYGAICIDTGSMAEMAPWMTNAECAERTGMHLWDDIVYTEIVDPETHEPISGEGVGVPVYTHLERTSQPMVRLFSGDLTRVTSEPCPCGRTYRRLPEGIFGRVDDMLIVRGVNVYPHMLEDAIASVPGIGSEYRIVVERPDELDDLIVEVEAADSSLAVSVREKVKATAGITPVVKIHEPNTLPTTEFKSARVTDLRRLPQ